ncbi:hypothetical protein BSLG_006058 [Batrachochytrium salamandrivorans]|nr:hypothetical protein BSLG_006058 [Batrachochytrium salamandrivorans]
MIMSLSSQIVNDSLDWSIGLGDPPTPESAKLISFALDNLLQAILRALTPLRAMRTTTASDCAPTDPLVAASLQCKPNPKKRALITTKTSKSVVNGSDLVMSKEYEALEALHRPFGLDELRFVFDFATNGNRDTGAYCTRGIMRCAEWDQLEHIVTKSIVISDGQQLVLMENTEFEQVLSTDRNDWQEFGTEAELQFEGAILNQNIQ